MDEVTYTTRQRKLYKTNKYHLAMAIIGAEDEKIDHLKKNILILISGRSIAFWRQTGAGSGPYSAIASFTSKKTFVINVVINRRKK